MLSHPLVIETKALTLFEFILIGDMSLYVSFFDKRGRPYLFQMYPWVIQASGYESPIGFVVYDIQRLHSSLINTYDEYQDGDAVKYGINRDFFNMKGLRKRYGAR